MKTKTQKIPSKILISIVLLIISAAVFFPILYCICSAFKPRAELTAYPPTVFPQSFLYTDNFKAVFDMVPILRFMLNSLIVAGMGGLLRITFAILAAYSFSYYDFKGKKILFLLVISTMMLPADTLVVTNFLTVSRLNLMDNYMGMCITSLVGASQMFMLRQSFKIIPRALRNAALIDGCGDIKFLLYIVMPMSKAVVFTMLVQSFVSIWNAYLWPLLVTNKTHMRTVQVGITMLTTVQDTNYSLVMAAVSIVLIPSFILFVFLRKSIVLGVSAGSIVG